MLSSLNNIKIVHKLYASFALIALMVFGLAGFAFLNMKTLQGTFGDYLLKSQKADMIGDFWEDMAEARQATFKYRSTGSQASIETALSNIDEIIELKPEAQKLFSGDPVLEELMSVLDEVRTYRETFVRATTYQGRRHELVAQLDDLGPGMMNAIGEIKSTAYRDQDFIATYYAAEVIEDLMEARLQGKAYLLENKPEQAQATIAGLQAAITGVDELLTELQNPVRRELAQGLRNDLEAYQAAFEEVSGLITERNALYTGVMDVIGPQVANKYEDLYDEESAEKDALGPRALRIIDNTVQTTLMTGLVIGIIAVILSLIIGRFIASNFASVINQTERLAEGDKSFEIKGAERGDEIGSLAKALQIFRKNALEVEKLQEEQKEAEQRQAEERKKAMQDLANQFETQVGEVIEKVDKSAKDLQSMATTLASAVEQTSQQSSAVAAASQEASSNVETVASAAEEMSASIREISQSVSKTASSAKTCADTATSSQAKLDELQKAVGEIDSVIQAINDVAEQTNLLALNATIEAARAGEAGKGFAVVASEVKELAGQTHKMTDEIAQKVEHIKLSATETIGSVGEIVRQITEVDEQTTSVSAAIEEQNSSTAEISRNVQQAAKGTDEVSRNINGIQEAANDSASSTEQLKSSSDDLAMQASNLKSAVDQFLVQVRTGS